MRRALVAAALAAAIAGCGRSALSDRAAGMNVLLLVVDTQRADHVSCYGYERETTPNADRLASRGVLFRDASVQASFSQGSYASLFTGLHPQSHGVRDHPSELGPEFQTMAEVLKGSGFRTAGFHNHPLLLFGQGFDQGMDTFEDHRTAADIVDRALEWIALDRASRWFLFLQFMEPHASYDPPPPFDERFGKRPEGFLEGSPLNPDGSYPSAWAFDFASQGIRPQDFEHLIALYDGEIAYVDAQIGRLMDALERSGLRDRTLIVYTSDHGEAFGEHGVYFNHDATLYQEVLHVPLILSNPTLFPQPVAIDDSVRQIDVLPTVLDLLGLRRAAPRMEGATLLPLLAGRSATWPVFAESRPFVESRARYPGYRSSIPGNEGKWRSVREGSLKLVRIPGARTIEEELYDLSSDPKEWRDIAREDPRGRQRLSRTIDRFMSRAAPVGDRTVIPTPELNERLKSLGYMGDSPPETRRQASPLEPPPRK
jgi:choline-sulfatase